jgi:arsenate reductase-like glutaredoxin family protein
LIPLAELTIHQPFYCILTLKKSILKAEMEDFLKLLNNPSHRLTIDELKAYKEAGVDINQANDKSENF